MEREVIWNSPVFLRRRGRKASRSMKLQTIFEEVASRQEYASEKAIEFWIGKTESFAMEINRRRIANADRRFLHWEELIGIAMSKTVV